MRGHAARISLFAVALLIGLLGVGQLRSQARPTQVSSLSAQDLSTLIETLTRGNRELRTGLADTREQLREYRIAGSQGQSAIDVSREDLRRISAFGGLAAVEGQGIVLNINGELDAIALNDLINELRNAGAEAIAVDAIRVTAHSVAVQGPLALQIDGVNISRRFVLRAIGSPDGLTAAIQRPGGIISQLKLVVRATIDLFPAESVGLPATEQSLAPTVGRPAEG